jgi:hypothetical protein
MKPAPYRIAIVQQSPASSTAYVLLRLFEWTPRDALGVANRQRILAKRSCMTSLMPRVGMCRQPKDPEAENALVGTDSHPAILKFNPRALRALRPTNEYKSRLNGRHIDP